MRVGFLIFIYISLMLLVIRWGIPNPGHPYNYQMDEWHTLMAVKSVFKHGTAAIEGSAHGPIFYYFTSGLFLIPFTLLGIIDPFAIKYGLNQLAMQERLFVILRLNTLIYGVLAIIFLAKILKDIFKINSSLSIILFIFTPVWLCLSNYFKYDIALVFWILVFLFSVFRYSQENSLKNFLLAGISVALALGTKISALPLLLLYIFSFFWFTKTFKNKFSILIKGVFLMMFIFLFTGIPDIFFKAEKYYEFLVINLSDIPSQTANFKFGMPYWFFMILQQFPTNYGYFFSILFFISLLYFLTYFLKKSFSFKKEVFVIVCFFLFIISLIPLKIYATGNRSLVLLPFMTIMVGIFINKLKSDKNWQFFKFVLIAGAVFQILQSISFYSIKIFPDPRKLSSEWIKQYIPSKTKIGIENVPIYQMLPDIVLKEFYSLQNNPNTKTIYQYEVIDQSAEKLPPVVIVTNGEIALKHMKYSSKISLIEKLDKEGYKKTTEFLPDYRYYKYFCDEFNFFISNLVPSSTINIYIKK